LKWLRSKHIGALCLLEVRTHKPRRACAVRLRAELRLQRNVGAERGLCAVRRAPAFDVTKIRSLDSEEVDAARPRIDMAMLPTMW